ncbi:MAG TPA: DUF3806 domain-containing protein [Stellaceae bacterium]|nr:DUF3806 domain-containing protein [Stellaceae bacterium]
MPAKISPLNAAENAYVTRKLGEAPAFVTRFSPGDADRAVTLDSMDRAFAAWLSSDPQSSDEINQTINLVGAVLGDTLCREAGFAWVIANDEYGTDLAVMALPDEGDVLVYPANFVAKRWERRETGFLAASCKAIAADTKAIAATHRR